MATNTTNYNFKKPDESDFYSVQDQNNNWDKADAALKDVDTPTFEDYSGSTPVPDAATAINNIRSKGKLSTILSNMKAAFKGACLIGQIVNNCVTNNAKLPLSAAQGKALMDLYTVLNSNFTQLNSDLGDKFPNSSLLQLAPDGNGFVVLDNYNSTTNASVRLQFDQNGGLQIAKLVNDTLSGIKTISPSGWDKDINDKIVFDGVGKVVFAQNSTAMSIHFYTTAVNYLYIEFLTATKNIKFGFYNGSTWTDYWIM